MGKRKNKGGLSGLCHFLPESFEKNSESSTIKENVVTDQENGVELSEAPATKRQKTSNGDSEVQSVAPVFQVRNHYAMGLVPYYGDASEVPEHLQKYFAQRFRLFSLYSTPPGCLLDEEGWYSVTPELVANQIAERCRCDTVLDAFCGVGGNTIAFAKTCERVIAIDTSPVRIALARHNAQIYGVADRIEFVLGDYVSFANSYLQHSPASRRIDVVFLSPPWGGPSYLSGTPHETPEDPQTPTESGTAAPLAIQPYLLTSVRPIPGAELFKLSRKITRNIAYYLPRNTCLDDISALLTTEEVAVENEPKQEVLEMVEVEEEWMGSKLKALTCYFGGLATGQETLFDVE